MASAGEDKSVILWDIGSGQKIRSLIGHTKTIWSVNFSQEGAVLASGSADQTVRLWDVNRARNLSYVPPEAVEEEVRCHCGALHLLTHSATGRRKAEAEGDHFA